MRNLKSFLCIICASFVLVGCSYFDIGEPEVSANPEQIDLMADQQAQDVAPAPAQDMDLMNNMSSESVQVFPLDGPSAAPAQDNGSVSAWGHAPRNTSNDPSVQVFPLDDAMAEAIHPTGLAPTGSPAPLLPENSNAPVSRSRDGNHAQVFFDHNSGELDSSAESVVSGFAQGHKGGTISVDGHASETASVDDPIQRKIINLKMSMERAFAVARRLIEDGVPAESIRTSAWGETRPGESEAASRRVDISSP
jgi:outer membrane protein OmpA-like peptidoglycan-associated protein